MKRLITFIFLIVLISILTTTAFAYVGPAFVATNNLNVYDGGGWNCNIIDCLPRNTNVTIESDAGYGWYKISYDSGSGYVAGYYLLFGIAPEEPVQTRPTQQISTPVSNNGNGSICADEVNMRGGPSLQSDVINCLSNGTAINIHGACGDWYEVDYNGITGYIYGTYVRRNGQVTTTVIEPIVEENETQTTGNDIVNAAMQYLGVPYIWGGESARGFDCSGLVYIVYKQNGININRVAQDMYYNGREVNLNSLKPGDILLFGSSIYNIRHVGIYTGNGMVIHSSYGDAVRNQSISEIQGMTLVGARRLV